MDTAGVRRPALEAALDALARLDWAGALEELEVGPLDDPVAEAERLDLRADALWWLGRMEDVIVAREAAYNMFEGAGEGRPAGQAAVWLFEHHCMMGRPSIGSGWLRRARRLLESESPECVEWGNLLVREAEMAHGAGELSHAIDNATTAMQLGRRLRSVDLEAEALQALARVLIDDGRPREGMAHFDEVMLLVVEGRLGPYAAGKTYCSFIGACEDIGDLARAHEWTEATVRWTETHPSALFPGLCRVKRAVALQRRGDWAGAEREARLACEELATVKVDSAGAAWAEVGDIRRRLGDLDEAEAAFARAQELGGAPVGPLALLRLAQGRLDAARSLVAGALGDSAQTPTARARILPAAVQIAVAAGDLDIARKAADELDQTAAQYETTGLQAAACLARGRVQLAGGEAAAACGTLRRALEQWTALGDPYEAATAQLLLGEACRQTGDREGEATAFAAAAAAFDRLGASLDVRRLRELTTASALPGGLSEREAEVIRLVAEGATNREIARKLAISEKTVARHLSNIFVKTGATSRTAAAAFAFEHGLAGRSR